VSAKVHPLKDNQARAVDPRDSVWLSASAGTGKTQVLSARVLRLLLRPGVRPEQILCLTFTKAGAAEMATRVNEVLAGWVRMKDEALSGDLIAIGAPNDPATRAHARTLFASVLDCPGGGLRIDTIHAFAQFLLGAFPEEAGLLPGTRAMEDRDRDVLAHRVLADLLVEWEASGDAEAIAALEMLSKRMGPKDARAWLMRCALAHEAWFGTGALKPPMRPRVMQLLGLPADATREKIAGMCADGSFDLRNFDDVLATYRAWGTKQAASVFEPMETWRAGEAAVRLEGVDDLRRAIFNNKGDPKYANNAAKHGEDLPGSAERLREQFDAIIAQVTLLDLVDFVTPALEVGRKFALRWDEAKTREGLADFDDLIRQAARLLRTEGLGDWIRFKLDRRFDHVLVDEAQDTNAAQWAIVDALTDDFFTGLGQRGDILRTIFVVGDYKQAIFRFQGTSPENFAAARRRYTEILRSRAENARMLRENIEARELVDLDLGRSYRSAQPVLDFVDEAIGAIGHEQIGLDRVPERHVGFDAPGLVAMWQPVTGAAGGEDDEGEEGWVSTPERIMADRLATQIRQWLETGFALNRGEKRNAGPGDIMVLVRKRRELAGLIVARLHAAGIPVAGVDRLRLGAPLAVKDVLAALRFAVQPRDDLSLANLLVSPLIGWSQAQLLEFGYRPEKRGLWDHLRDLEAPEPARVVAMLRDLLARADYEPPQALLHWMLTGPWDGRRKLVARLGREANDPLDELLGAASQYASTHTPSLQGFLSWFDAGEGELKREPDSDAGLVRVMTVHGAKGLQAPIVILADATGNPDRSPTRGLELAEPVIGGEGRMVPLPDLRSAEKVGPIGTAEERAAQEERQEHWRLLYVAMTRAEEALFVGGSLGALEKAPADDSWYARLAPLFAGDEIDDPIWGMRKERGQRAEPIPRAEQHSLPIPTMLPQWALRAVGEEPRPPKPLAPSSAGEDKGADPPLPPDQLAIAARRGVLIHALLERLPDLALNLREERGRAWLARQARDLDEVAREEMLARALAVLGEPGWTELFGPAALAEVPLAATVGGQVIAGIADRLLVEESRVLVADFKTARRPPSSLSDVPLSTLRQMGAYAAALEVIFPGRAIEAAMLYTQTPQLIAIPADVLAAHKPGLADVQESLSGSAIAQ